MKKVILTTFFLFSVISFTYANQGHYLSPGPSIHNSAGMIENNSADQAKEYFTLLSSSYRVTDYYTFNLSCGGTIEYSAPDGECFSNVINTAITLNNSICGTNIPLFEEVEEGGC